MKKLAVTLILATSALTSMAHADLGYGFGATWVFGSTQDKGLAIGPKLFTANEEDKIAGSLGLDYVFKTSSIRPSIGISYLFKEDMYTNLNVGYDLKDQKVNFGFEGGYTDTQGDVKQNQPR